MSYYIIGLLLSLMSWSCSDDAETGREEIPVETDGGYLFAHMTNANYSILPIIGEHPKCFMTRIANSTL